MFPYVALYATRIIYKYKFHSFIDHNELYSIKNK